MAKYTPNSRGICPYCRTTVNFENPKFRQNQPYEDSYLFPYSEKENLCITCVQCPACLRLVITIETLTLAISRRCLQTILSEVGGTKAKDLSKQIDEVLPKLPNHIAESIDAVRNIGNFAAHPQKSQSSGTILDVEPGEAEWTLDVAYEMRIH